MFRRQSIVANYETNAKIATVRRAERSIWDLTKTIFILTLNLKNSNCNIVAFLYFLIRGSPKTNHMIHKYVLVDFLPELLLLDYKGIF